MEFVGCGLEEICKYNYIFMVRLYDFRVIMYELFDDGFFKYFKFLFMVVSVYSGEREC